MKKITYIIALFFAFNLGFGQTVLSEGDIAITGANQDGNDQFAFVLLTDVLNGTTINFTDCGWLASGGFRNYNPVTGTIGEGALTWTAPSDLPCGTQVVIENTFPNTYLATIGTAIGLDAGFSISASGDEILVFQGTIASPTFLYALHFANSDGWTDAIDTNSSAVPAGLTEGVNAMAFSMEDCIYNCAVTNNQTLILEAIVNSANWTGSDSVIQTLAQCTFTCSTPATCVSSVTWNGSWSGTPTLSTEVTISANFDTGIDGNFQACSLTVDAGATLNVADNRFVEVENSVVINGAITVQTNGNFVQNDNGGTFTVHPVTGTALVNKQTAVKNAWYYYTYWSSPVSGQTISGAFPFTDGDRRFYYDASNYIDATGDDIDDNGDDWQYALGGTTMTPGVGYAATSGRLGMFPRTDIVTFTGDFNTGDIPTNIVYNAINTLGSWNFIGNPYPSAIDFIAFQAANSSIVDGAAYFWSQSSPPLTSNPGNQNLNFNQNDYATFTVGSGGSAGASGETPNGYIPSGQGFFIASLSNGTATFTNAMRMADGTSNTQFFKSSNINNKSVVDNKLWVNLTSDNGVFNQILVAYVEGATNDNDGLFYDAPRLLASDFPAALYSNIENSNKKFVIQGKDINSINVDENIQLGFATNIEVSTLYTLSIAQLQGAFLTNNKVYLKDNLLNKLHDLSAGDYTFASEVGEFNNRFEIVFNAASPLSTDEKVLEDNVLSIVELEDDHVQFSTYNNLKIQSVGVFDLLGRQLYQFKGQNIAETYRLSNLSSTVYIAKVTLSNGAVITKKAVKR